MSEQDPEPEPADSAETDPKLPAAEQIRALLARHRALEAWTHNQAARQRQVLESLVHRQNLAELQMRLRALPCAELVGVLQALPPPDRALVWEQLKSAQAGPVLAELPRPVREELVDRTPRHVLAVVLDEMDAADLAFVAESMPADVLEEAYRRREAREAPARESGAATDSVAR